MFKRNLTYAEMYEYKDSTYDFVIRYPSFFSEQPNDVGHARFCYSDQWATVVLEGYTMRAIRGRASKRQVILWLSVFMPLCKSRAKITSSSLGHNMRRGV